MSSSLMDLAQSGENMPEMEQQWAVKALHHAETYMRLLRAVPGGRLRLTPIDADILLHFRRVFPTLSVAKLDEDEMKNSANKVVWRAFCEEYKKKVDDYHFGTLLRADASADLGEHNSILVPRVVFYAIELARNQEGLNNWLHSTTATAAATDPS